jgi:hypothetical protein
MREQLLGLLQPFIGQSCRLRAADRIEDETFVVQPVHGSPVEVRYSNARTTSSITSVSMSIAIPSGFLASVPMRAGPR